MAASEHQSCHEGPAAAASAAVRSRAAVAEVAGVAGAGAARQRATATLAWYEVRMLVMRRNRWCVRVYVRFDGFVCDPWGTDTLVWWGPRWGTVPQKWPDARFGLAAPPLHAAQLDSLNSTPACCECAVVQLAISLGNSPAFGLPTARVPRDPKGGGQRTEVPTLGSADTQCALARGSRLPDEPYGSPRAQDGAQDGDVQCSSLNDNWLASDSNGTSGGCPCNSVATMSGQRCNQHVNVSTCHGHRQHTAPDTVLAYVS